MTQPDLQANIYSQSYDTEGGTSPSIVLGDHATAVTGIIGAAGNTVGIKGVAPNCKLMSVSNSMASTTLSRMKRGEGINWAVQHGASVINNSWGSSEQVTIIDNAISNALINGRNGLGSIVVFSSGNDNGAVSYPANYTNNILAVGAISPCGQRKNPTSCDTESAWGSNFGTTLDVVAPGVLIPTTDRVGSALGYNSLGPIHPSAGGTLLTSDYTNFDYTVWFNGTSAAAPHVSGLAALILSINSALTGQQVRDIIEKTAQKVGPYTYSTTTGRPNGTWNQEMGYGLINACGAVLETYKTLSTATGPYLLFCSPTQYTVNYLPPQATISWTKSDNISIVSSQGSNPCNFQANGAWNGPGWIRATIITDCGNIVLPDINVWVGKFDATVVQGQAAVCPNSLYTYTAVVPGGHSSSYSYNWTYPSNWTKTAQYQNFIQLQTPLYNPNYGTVRVSITNPCGASGYSGITVYPKSSCGGYFSLYPNPASDNVTITIIENSLYSTTIDTVTTEMTNSNMNYSNADIPAKFTIHIYNNNGLMLSNLTRSGKSFNVPLTNMRDGTYIIEINDGQTSYSQQLIIKHK